MPDTASGETFGLRAKVRRGVRDTTMLETLSGRDPRTKTKDEPQAEAAPVAPPCAMVIFGAAGDLTKRLVVPALYNLVNAGQLADGFRLVGVDLASKTADDWRKEPHRNDEGASSPAAASFRSTSWIRTRGDGSATA